MPATYSLLFYLKKPKNYVSGPKPIYMRITVSGIPKEISTGRDCALNDGTPKPTGPKESKRM